MAGQMVHVEIPAGDTGKAREFWGGLFGWEFQAYRGQPDRVPHGPLLGEPGRRDHGRDDGSTKGPRVYFDVDDINAGAARVKELGGEASDAMAVPGMGWFATCTDTQGNEFGLWQTDPSASM